MNTERTGKTHREIGKTVLTRTVDVCDGILGIKKEGRC